MGDLINNGDVEVVDLKSGPIIHNKGAVTEYQQMIQKTYEELLGHNE